jgi:hypothetical protein
MNHEEEIVGSGYDAARDVFTYTGARNGKRWTIEISNKELDQFGPVLGMSAAQNSTRRRDYLAQRMNDAMRGPADGE